MSLHGKILTEIEQNILSGRWPPGYRIPSEMELTVHYDCSRMTVSKALNKLVQAGLLERKRNLGSGAITRPGDNFPGADICKNCPLIIFKKEREA